MRSINDFVGTLREVPSDRLVELLREVHLGRTPGAPSPSSVSQRAGESGRSGDTLREPAGDQDEGEAQRFFVDLERRLTEQRTTAEALIQRLRLRDRARRVEAPRPPSQQLLKLVALPGTVAGGRFLVLNPDDRDLRLEFRVGEARFRDRREAACPEVSLAPAVLTLAPRQRRLVRLEVDLRRTPLVAGEFVEIPVDAMAGGKSVMKVWVEIA
ncbi:MAG: hypothetical protein ABR538_09720, partial [Candidatus Binatia bacterium]